MKQSGNTGEVVLLAARQTPEMLIRQPAVGFDEEAVMNAIVANVLAREAENVQTNPHPLALIALFCGVGLVASLILVSAGFDLGTAFF
jgi:hypothetical protein